MKKRVKKMISWWKIFLALFLIVGFSGIVGIGLYWHFAVSKNEKYENRIKELE